MCRQCRFYRPSEQYKGVIGWCDKNDHPTRVDYTCVEQESGDQTWMCGAPVSEDKKTDR